MLAYYRRPQVKYMAILPYTHRKRIIGGMSTLSVFARVMMKANGARKHFLWIIIVSIRSILRLYESSIHMAQECTLKTDALSLILSYRLSEVEILLSMEMERRPAVSNM